MAIQVHNETLDLSGDWFVPEEPTRIISGVLRYARGTAILDLNDAFEPVRGDVTARGAIKVYPVVHGTTWDGRKVTLIDAHRAGFSINIGHGQMRQPERLMTTLPILGIFATHDTLYEEAELRIPGLEIWLCRASVNQEFGQDENGPIIWRYAVKTGISDETAVPVLNAKFTWSLEVRGGMGSFTTVNVTAMGWVKIRPAQPQPITWYLEQRHKLITLLSFLAGVPMSDDAMNVCMQGVDVAVLVGSPDPGHCRLINMRDFFMWRNAMGIDMELVVAKWFEKYPKVQMAVDLARSVLGSNNLWPHVEYLSLMQALEGFHRSQCDGMFMDLASYDAVKQALGNAIPANLSQSHKDALRSRIRYGNELSLRRRFEDLAKSLSDSLRKLIIGETGNVPQSWIDTRNFYTHWDEDLRANVLDGQGMRDTIVRLRHFVRVLYLRLAGIPDTAIVNCICNSFAAQDLVQLNFPSGVLMSINEQPVASAASTDPQAAAPLPEPASKNDAADS